MTTPGDVLSLTIEKPASGGRMIARTGGMVVLVSGTIPGETVRATVERVGKGVLYASAIHVDEPSPDRRTPQSDPSCGGCAYAHIAYPRQLEIKAQVIADAFARIGQMPLLGDGSVAVAASPERGYRMRARVHRRGRAIGFYRENTRQVCDARPTGQLLPDTVDALERLAAAVASAGIDEAQEIEVAENIDASERVVALETHRSLDRRTVDLLAGTEGITGLFTPRASTGHVTVTDTLSVGDGQRVALTRHVLAFFQGNRFLLNALVDHVLDQIPANGDVLDLYAGVGVFAMSAALARGSRVTAVEGERVSAADLERNAAGTGGAVTAVHASVESMFDDRGSRPSARAGSRPRSTGWPAFDRTPATVIVDPPRTGMSKDALDGVVTLQAPRIVYVSCDPPTLARDARRLVDAGYTISSLQAFDLFPNTPHVETVAVFNR